MHKSWIVTTFINFSIAAIFGLLLRAAFIWDISFVNYNFFLHAHSHIAMLGWVYLAIYSLFVDCFIPEEKRKKSIFSRLFWFTQMSVVGMMISFPLQGYAAFSITFSTLHIIASYIFAILIWRNLDKTNLGNVLLIRTSLLMMILSTIGIWLLGPAISMGFKSSPIYLLLIQFYLHFQFNGWFVIAILALFIHLINRWRISIEIKKIKWFLFLYLLSVVTTYFHVLGWAYNKPFLYLINSIGVVLQIVSFTVLFSNSYPLIWSEFKDRKGLNKSLFVFAIISFGFKLLLQLGLVIPSIAEVSTAVRNFMIGYIHLVMLGFISAMLFLFIKQRIRKSINKSGFYIFMTGFILSELVLFLQGVLYITGYGMLPSYYYLLFGVSVLLPVGILVLLFSFREKNNVKMFNN